MEMVCCSMASWMATLSSSLIWEEGRGERESYADNTFSTQRML